MFVLVLVIVKKLRGNFVRERKHLTVNVLHNLIMRQGVFLTKKLINLIKNFNTNIQENRTYERSHQSDLRTLQPRKPLKNLLQNFFDNPPHL